MKLFNKKVKKKKKSYYGIFVMYSKRENDMKMCDSTNKKNNIYILFIR